MGGIPVPRRNVAGWQKTAATALRNFKGWHKDQTPKSGDVLQLVIGWTRHSARMEARSDKYTMSTLPGDGTTKVMD